MEIQTLFETSNPTTDYDERLVFLETRLSKMRNGNI